MEFNDVIRQRRAVREYTSQSIDCATIEKLIDAAIQAPSAENHQPWAFAVLLNSQKIDMYAERAKQWLLQQTDNSKLSPALHVMLANPQLSIFYHAPALVVVSATSASAQAQQDSCLAAETLLLAARDYGLGSCWIGLGKPWLDLYQTKAEIGIPVEHTVVAPIVIGYPSQWPAPHERRTPLIHWLQ